jgi:serine/threonine protein kinase/tetratricopeptide (TPR) repeat protein
MSPCPSPEQLRDLLADRPGNNPVEAHVEGCVVCQEALERLTASAASPARPGPNAAPEAEGPLGDLLRRLERALPVATSPTLTAEQTAPGDPRAAERTDEGPAIGRMVSHFLLVRRLGRGGMGVVYEARDTRLGRHVALKFLPAEYTRDRERLGRFQREARTASALNHPHICIIHDFAEHEGQPVLVMELIDGRTVRALMGAPLALETFVPLAGQVARALVAAHAAGIVHRDIKPENIMVRADGYAKVVDFGLARAVPAELLQAGVCPAATDPGTLVGTVQYMSPEQARGEAVGTGSDIFSLGIVLYELATGHHPFPADSRIGVLHAIVSHRPQPASRRNPELPSGLTDLLRRMLAKAAARRPTADEVVARLAGLVSDRRPASGVRPRHQAVRSLAVLPLVNANADPDTEYLADGITESLINLLSRLPGLRVMARSTVFRYKGPAVDPREVGRALGVRAVLTGRLSLRGNRLLLGAELVDVNDGSQLWGEQYDREFSDVLAIEKAIAREIADRLSLRLTGEQKDRLRRPATVSAEAYRCYLKGRYYWNKRSEEGLRKSIKLFEEATGHDPTFALAYTGVADAYLNLGGWGHLPFREAYPRARAAAARALSIDGDLAEAHVSLAMVDKEYEWDWPAAGRGYKRALELNPNCATAYQWYGEYLAALGRHAEAIAAIQRATDLDPLSLIINATLGRHGYHFARRFEEAIVQLRKTLEMDENFWVAHHFLGWTYACAGRLPEALAAFQVARRLEPDNLEIQAILGYANGRAGQLVEARRALEVFAQASRTRYVSPMLPALISLGMGEHDQALGWLEKAYDDRAQMLSEARVEPIFDPLRADPRFADLLRRVGFEPA